MAESGFDPNAGSPAGAQGIAQFMPSTAAAYGLTNPFDPVAAIDAEAHLMSDLIAKFGSPQLALAAYNAGPAPVEACHCVPAYPETQAYVTRILALLGGAGALVVPSFEVGLGAGVRGGMGDVAGGAVLDLDVLIDYLRGAGAGRELVRALTGGAGYRVTAITAFELALGRAYGENPRPVHALLAAPLLTLTRKAGLRGGALLGELRQGGVAIDVRDAMQAGICLEAGATLVTRNLSHFERVPGLRLLHPAESF
jgi:predicted nucleic acid-binding protein